MSRFKPTHYKVLIWFIILTQILFPLGTATLAALQPTPQMVQDAAYELHLPGFLVDGLTELRQVVWIT